MISKQSDFPADFKRTQFPIIPAHFLTFNRAQGQSLEQSGLELPESVFSHGQLYVGLSRNGDPDRVFVHANQDEFINLQQQLPQQQTFTKNIVYKDIFY
jgi:ATP-dependent DNA helicase PIF1